MVFEINVYIEIILTKTLWHANQIINMLETQGYIFFLSFHVNFLFNFFQLAQ